MLEVKEMVKNFGGLKAVSDVSFSIKDGHINSLIGPNGAGKTTMFDLISGNIQPTSGYVSFKNNKITGLRPYQIARLGLIRTFQNIKLFKGNNFTVLENLMVGFDQGLKIPMLLGGIGTIYAKREDDKGKKRAQEIAEMIGLTPWLNRPVSELTTGFQRLLELGRALMAGPQLLLLDEPAAGLNDSETNQLIKILYSIKNRGTTILLVEHHMGLVMEVSDRIIVMNNGQKIAEGCPADISNHPEVIKAYIGEDDF